MHYVLVNFGGPRDVDEIVPFLTALLQDRDVVRTKWPDFFHRWFFGRIAQKRAKKIRADYEAIGGKSPIYSDTENLAKLLSEKLKAPVLTFHRYLPMTHKKALQHIENSTANEIRVIPLFPQFCYATTGSIARLFKQKLSPETETKLRWVHSYAAHFAFVQASQRRIHNFLKENTLSEDEVMFLFSAHGVPVSFIETGDPYAAECKSSFEAIASVFPRAQAQLCYQSKFGPGEWLKPSTQEACEHYASDRTCAIIVPLSFTTDHIETLFEIEKQYLPILKAKGIRAFRCPALNLEPYWIDALENIAHHSSLTSTQMLIRPSIK